MGNFIRKWMNNEDSDEEDVTQHLKDRLRLVSKWSEQDTREYRNGYPNKVDVKSQKDNLLFYSNEIASKPDGDKIEDILRNWKGNYEKLERHHGYIQWLFPIREPGMNFLSQELQKHEAEAIATDETRRNRFLSAYELMLDFYGLRLKDRETGEIERGENWQKRLEHLNTSYHNYLRITRVLKSLGELGCEHMKYPLVHFLLKESIYDQTIPNAAKSCVEYWAQTLRNEEQRASIIREVKDFIDSDQKLSEEAANSARENQILQRTARGQKKGRIKYNSQLYTPLKTPAVPENKQQETQKQGQSSAAKSAASSPKESDQNSADDGGGKQGQSTAAKSAASSPKESGQNSADKVTVAEDDGGKQGQSTAVPADGEAEKDSLTNPGELSDGEKEVTSTDSHEKTEEITGIATVAENTTDKRSESEKSEKTESEHCDKNVPGDRGDENSKATSSDDTAEVTSDQSMNGDENSTATSSDKQQSEISGGNDLSTQP